MPQSTIPQRLLEHARRRGSENALYEREHDRWLTLTWRQYADRALALAASLLKLGCQKGDAIAIIGDGFISQYLKASPFVCQSHTIKHRNGIIAILL